MSNKDSTKMWLWTQVLTNGKHIPSWNDDLLCSHEVNESGQYLKILTFPSWFAFEINEVPKLMISVCEVIPLIGCVWWFVFDYSLWYDESLILFTAYACPFIVETCMCQEDEMNCTKLGLQALPEYLNLELNLIKLWVVLVYESFEYIANMYFMVFEMHIRIFKCKVPMILQDATNLTKDVIKLCVVCR